MPASYRYSQLLRRDNAQDPSRRIVGGEPQRAVGTLPHVADALVEPLEEPLLGADRFAVDLEPHQQRGGKRTDEQVAAPGRKQVAGVKSHAGRSDRRHPVLDRLLHPLLVCALVNPGAIVVDAVADHRPAVVLARLGNVDLVAAARAMLVLPQLPGLGIERRALRIAVAIAPDLRLGACPIYEWIVGRHRSVRPDA